MHRPLALLKIGIYLFLLGQVNYVLGDFTLTIYAIPAKFFERVKIILVFWT